jgi:hypothetical protein
MGSGEFKGDLKPISVSSGARIISSSHSPGGNLVIMGDTHQAIIMYRLGDAGVERLYEFTAHSVCN